MAANLYTILSATGLPVAYNVFQETQAPPYILFRLDDTDNVAADDRVYFKRENHIVELYSSLRDLTSEGKIETALNNAGIFWDKDDDWIESEKLYMAAYSIQI